MTGYDENVEARKRLPIKSDLDMWHKFVGFAGWLILIAKVEERKLYSKCVHYSYDSDAFEEYCDCSKIERGADFNADDECWKCSFYKLSEVSP